MANNDEPRRNVSNADEERRKMAKNDEQRRKNEREKTAEATSGNE